MVIVTLASRKEFASCENVGTKGIAMHHANA
jgi:hypothetical protein